MLRTVPKLSVSTECMIFNIILNHYLPKVSQNWITKTKVTVCISKMIGECYAYATWGGHMINIQCLYCTVFRKEYASIVYQTQTVCVPLFRATVREKVHKKFSSYLFFFGVCLKIRKRLLEAAELETRRNGYDKCMADNHAI